MPPAWKVRQGHLVFGSSVRLSVCPYFHPAYKVQYLKFGWLYSNQTWDCKFIYGFLTLHWHPMPVGGGVGWGQNVGFRDFAIFWLCCRRGHPCFTSTCLVEFWYACFHLKVSFHQFSSIFHLQASCSTLTLDTYWVAIRSPSHLPWGWARKWWTPWAGPTRNISTTSKLTATPHSWLWGGLYQFRSWL